MQWQSRGDHIVAKSNSLREQDVRAMLRLMAELTQLPPDPTLRMRHLMEGAGRLLNARAVYATRFRSHGPGKKIQPYAGMQIGFTPAEFDAAMMIAANDPLHDFVNDEIHAASAWPTTFVTAQLDPERKRQRREQAARNARRLGLSQHTVNDHMKDLYRRFGVSGRSELMAAFVKR